MVFSDQQKRCLSDIDQTLTAFIQPKLCSDTRLHQAITHAMANLGKCIRPLLVYTTGEMLGAPRQALHMPAAALELLHTYSLVHDDLPAMDDDTLRRGQPTVHCQFDEATAILAGNCLQTLSFELLTQAKALHPETKIKLIAELAHASGPLGICLGQSLDLAAENKQLQQAELTKIHQHKTQQLIRCAVRFGYVCAQIDNLETCKLLDDFANDLGLAYQIQDDILDIESDTHTLGKPQGSDEKSQKWTYPKAMGLSAARNLATSLHQQALTKLEELPFDTQNLREITHSLVCRTH